MPFPQLETERLLLRRPCREDAPVITELLQEREIANNLLSIPYPYSEADALEFLEKVVEQPAEVDPAYIFAMTRRGDGAFLGVCGIHTNEKHSRAMLGYWLGKPYWGQN